MIGASVFLGFRDSSFSHCDIKISVVECSGVPVARSQPQQDLVPKIKSLGIEHIPTPVLRPIKHSHLLGLDVKGAYSNDVTCLSRHIIPHWGRALVSVIVPCQVYDEKLLGPFVHNWRFDAWVVTSL